MQGVQGKGQAFELKRLETLLQCSTRPIANYLIWGVGVVAEFCFLTQASLSVPDLDKSWKLRETSYAG